MDDAWLSQDTILVDVDAAEIGEVIAAAAQVLGPATGVDPKVASAALNARAAEGGIALGQGVAVPHAAVEGVSTQLAALIRTRAPIPLDAPDGQAVDLFFVVLGRPGEAGAHLLFLAHMARMCRSNLLIQGLRRAEGPGEMVALMQAAELRLGTSRFVPARPSASQALLVIITLAGERAIDRLLVDLVELGFGGASVFDTHTAQEAMTEEVPLFAGFKDLFGDPGGRRMITFSIEPSARDQIVALVELVCREEEAPSCQLHLLPVERPFSWPQQGPGSG